MHPPLSPPHNPHTLCRNPRRNPRNLYLVLKKMQSSRSSERLLGVRSCKDAIVSPSSALGHHNPPQGPPPTSLSRRPSASILDRNVAADATAAAAIDDLTKKLSIVRQNLAATQDELAQCKAYSLQCAASNKRLASANHYLLWEHLPTTAPRFKPLECGKERIRCTATHVGPYVLGRTIGSGQFGTVRTVMREEPSSKFKTSSNNPPASDSSSSSPPTELAMKFILKDSVSDYPAFAKVARELMILSSVSHPNITGLLEALVGEKAVFIVSEKASIDLYDYVGDLQPSKLPPACTRSVIRSITSALTYLHGRGVCHLDLKMENILVFFPKGDGVSPPQARPSLERSVVKLCDFGLAVYGVNAGVPSLTERCGTPGFFAPEMMSEDRVALGGAANGYCGQAADVWSAGCVTLELILGVPFADEWLDVYMSCVEGPLGIAAFDWQGEKGPKDVVEFCNVYVPELFKRYGQGIVNEYGGGALDFLRSALVGNPTKRATSNALMRGAWFRGEEVLDEGENSGEVVSTFRSPTLTRRSAGSSSKSSSATDRSVETLGSGGKGERGARNSASAPGGGEERRKSKTLSELAFPSQSRRHSASVVPTLERQNTIRARLQRSMSQLFSTPSKKNRENPGESNSSGSGSGSGSGGKSGRKAKPKVIESFSSFDEEMAMGGEMTLESKRGGSERSYFAVKSSPFVQILGVFGWRKKDAGSL